MKNVSFHLKTARVLRQNDGGSGGSDPYVLVTYFWGDSRDFIPNGHARVHVHTPVSSTFKRDVPDNLRVGNLMPVPPIQGRFQLKVDPIPNCFAGFVVVIMEEDQTSTDAVLAAQRAMNDAVQDQIQDRLRAHMSGDVIYSWNSTDRDRTRDRVRSTVRDTLKSNTSWWDRHTKDQDELVDVGVHMMMGRRELITISNGLMDLKEGNKSTDERYMLQFDVTVSNVRPPIPGDLDHRNCNTEQRAVQEKRSHVQALVNRKRMVQQQLQTAPLSHKSALIQQIQQLSEQIDAANDELEALEDRLDACVIRAEQLGERQQV